MLDRPARRAAPRATIADSFTRALCRREPMGELAPPGLESIRDGEAAGILLGGTLTQLLASLGTPFAFAPPQGYVLFLDEVGERPYRLDRMVTQLRQAGLLARASRGRHRRAAEMRRAVGRADRARGDGGPVRRFSRPVVIGFPSGHTVGPAMTLPFGVTCRVVGGPPAAPRRSRKRPSNERRRFI